MSDKEESHNRPRRWNNRSPPFKTKRNLNVVKQDNRNISLKIPLGKAKLNALVKAWISDGEVNVRLVEKPPTPQDKRDLNYHLFHRKVGHPTLDCYIIRKL